MSLPKEIFVTNENIEDDGGWYAVSLKPEDAVNGSELEAPVVGTYRLVEENQLELIRTVRLRKAKQTKKKAA
jgi:hypothetical protein